MNFINEIVTEFNELNISDKNPNSSKINHENCYNPPRKCWCKECVPRCIIEGWTSGNDDIDNLIKDSIYSVRLKYIGDEYVPSFLEWVPFDRFEDMKQIGEGGFAKVYSATWIDGIAKYIKDDGNWIKKEPESMKVALKRLNGSQNMSADFLNELKTHWKLNCLQEDSLKFYGITKDPETEEIMMLSIRNMDLDEDEKYGYKKEEVKAVFEEADKEIPNISTSYEKKPDAIYTSRAFTLSNVSKPINSSFIATTYLNEEDNEGCQDSQLINLEVPCTSKSEDDDNDD
ncbi:unnamed protein product [Rhizophagus irregularis]|nr:unnamed protein product [Rhizophagus irregularis]